MQLDEDPDFVAPKTVRSGRANEHQDAHLTSVGVKGALKSVMLGVEHDKRPLRPGVSAAEQRHHCASGQE